MLAAIETIMKMNLIVLYETSSLDLLVRQLNAMERWAELVPSVANVKLLYQQKLANVLQQCRVQRPDERENL